MNVGQDYVYFVVMIIVIITNNASFTEGCFVGSSLIVWTSTPAIWADKVTSARCTMLSLRHVPCTAVGTHVVQVTRPDTVTDTPAASDMWGNVETPSHQQQNLIPAECRDVTLVELQPTQPGYIT